MNEHDSIIKRCIPMSRKIYCVNNNVKEQNKFCVVEH